MKKILNILSILAVFFFVSVVQANESAYDQGSASLKTGDLNQALASFKQAVEKNPQNKEYVQEFMILRQVVAMQAQLGRETNPARWNAYSQRLRTYYEQKGVDSLSLDLNRLIYTRHPSTDNAAMLGESLIANDKAKEAIELLSKLPEKTPLAQAVLGLGYFKNDNQDEARKIVETISAGSVTNPIRFRLARLEAGLGEKDKTVSTLKTLFEQTPPSRQPTLREQCQNTKEFDSIQSDAGFTEVLQTPSKVAESACSGGSSCGSCPMRSKCQGVQ